MINRNMGCIEIEVYLEKCRKRSEINRNMGCIEIESAALHIQTARDKP